MNPPTNPQQRLIYGKCETESAVHQSTSPLMYQLDASKYVAGNPCMINGTLGGNTVSRASDRQSFIDIEHNLQNRARPMVRGCPADSMVIEPAASMSNLSICDMYQRPQLVLPPPMDETVYIK